MIHKGQLAHTLAAVLATHLSGLDRDERRTTQVDASRLAYDVARRLDASLDDVPSSAVVAVFPNAWMLATSRLCAADRVGLRWDDNDAQPARLMTYLIGYF